MVDSIGALLAERAGRLASAPCLIDAATASVRTYREVHERAWRWAAGFREAGLVRGDRLAVILPNSVDDAELLLGGAIAGLTLCPYNPVLTAPELTALVGRYGAKLALVAPSRREELAMALPIPVRAIGRAGDWPDALPAARPEGESAPPAHPFVLIMTSGTSGGAKACRITQANVLWTSARTAEAFGFDETSRYLTPLPLYHINAQVVGLLAAIQAGGAVAIGSRLPAPRLWEAAARCRATGMSAVPALVMDLLDHPSMPPETLRYVVCSSAPLSASVRERFERRFGIPLLVSYGLSEAGCFVSYGRPDSPMGSVGQPLGCEVRIEGEEILVQGAGLFEGYDEAATGLALRDGWLHTGDRGFLDADGFLYVTGRRKDQINRGGEKISPEAIEAVLLECPDLAEVAVFGVPDDRLGEEVAAAIVPKTSVALTDDDLWDFCADRLAEFETPRHWIRIQALPRGATGKVLRRELREAWGR